MGPWDFTVFSEKKSVGHRKFICEAGKQVLVKKEKGNLAFSFSSHVSFHNVRTERNLGMGKKGRRNVI